MTATTQPQHLIALARAQEKRLGVAAFKRSLHGLSQLDAVERVINAIEEHHDDHILGSVRVRHLLLAIPHVGDTKVAKLTKVAQVYNADKRLRDLTIRQRSLLAALLKTQAWRMS